MKSKKLKSLFYQFAKRVLLTVGFHLISDRNLEQQKKDSDLKNYKNIEFIVELISDKERLINLLSKSKSQINQDLFVLHKTNFKREGFFVEFGATNGIDLSNTYILEKDFNWAGILAEPGKIWHEPLKTNRSNSYIETACVWTDSGQELEFNETALPELSTINFFSDRDSHNKNRKNGRKYKVSTISLLDLLNKYNAPKKIDYLSIDTEGSEYEILSKFDFNSYSFSVITCEHNYTSNRSKIFELLSGYGYRRVHETLSHFDDWYILDDK